MAKCAKAFGLLCLAVLFASSLLTASQVSSAADSSATVTENTWTDRASIPKADGRVESAVVNGKIFVIGKSTNYMYDPASDVWTAKPPMPTPRTSFAMAAYQGIIYVIGGHVNGSSTGLNEAYNTSTDTWETKKLLPAARAQMDANMVNGKIYVIGGRTGDGMTAVALNDVYDPVTDSWTAAAPMPHLGVSYASAVVDSKIYVIEGQYEYESTMNPGYTQIFDTINNTWSQGTRVPNPIWMAPVACATAGMWAPKRIYVMGGIPSFGQATDRNIVYDPETDSWSTGASMPIPRSGFALAAVDDLLYAIGGTDGWLGTYTQNSQYTPFGYGTIPPPVTILSPEQNKTYTTSNVSLTFTVNRPVAQVSYSLDGQEKATLTENATLSGLSDGVHDVVVYASDAAGNTGASERVYFTVGVPPIISILSPANKTYEPSNITLTLTLSEPVSWTGYSLDGQRNMTFSGNMTLPELSYGSHNLTVYANDTAGNTGVSETIYFSVKEPFPTMLVAAAAVASVVAIGTGLIVYFKKYKR